MQWTNHYGLEGKHSFLSPSGWHWINYDAEKLEQTYINMQRKEKGTMYHAWASMAIKEGFKVAKLRKALNLFINDAIGMNMESEQILYYSDNCFGTADAIKYDGKENVLRVHDLKTGVHRASFNQLYIYCAIFCLEYSKDPYKQKFICRIYQGNDYIENEGNPDYIASIMDKIVEFDAQIDGLKNVI